MQKSVFTYFDLGFTLLEAAIDHYLADSYIPAILLAGAAEDHLGGPHASSGTDSDRDPRAHKQDARDFNLIHRHTFEEDHPRPWDAVNEVKNRVKHYNSAPLRIDAEDEAFWAIDRAIKNFCLCMGTYPVRTSDVDQKHAAHVLHNEALPREHQSDEDRGAETA